MPSSDPVLSYNLTATGGELTTPVCISGYNSTSTCPTNCLRPDFQDEDNCCTVRCPLGPPLYGETRAQPTQTRRSLLLCLTRSAHTGFRAIQVTNDVLGYLAFVATCITVALFAMNPAARKFPGA